MPFKLGTPELLILLVILIVLFGVGRIGKLGAELGKGIRELRRGISGDVDEEEREAHHESRVQREPEVRADSGVQQELKVHQE